MTAFFVRPYLCFILTFLFYVCDPSATLPDGAYVINIILYNICAQEIFIPITICALLHILLNFCCLFCANISFIPYNISLNLLPKRRKNKYVFNKSILHVYLIYTYICICDQKSSFVIIITDYTLLNTFIFQLISSVAWVFLFFRNKSILIIIRLGSLLNVFVLSPCFSFEFSAFWIFNLLILLSYDVHPNPGQFSNNHVFSSGFFSFCNWNLNTLSKDNFSRISLLEAHNTLFNYDIISLCETSLSDNTPVPENALPGYKYHPLNHPSGNKRGGVGIFYKDTLPLRVRNDLSFDECLVTELIFGRRKIFFSVFYRNPEDTVNSPEFENFLSNFENLNNKINSLHPFAVFYAGDVNGHTQSWFPEGNSSAEGVKLDDLFSTLSLHQMINEPTHFFRDDCIPSCIDIILTNQPNLVMDCGVRPSLDPTVKHQITFCKFNFKIPPPPNFVRKLWHFNRANSDAIKKAISQFSLENRLASLHNPNEQVHLLNKTILNIMSNFVPNEERKVRPVDPPCLSDDIRRRLRKHNKIYKKFKRDGFKDEEKAKIEQSKSKINNAIQTAKEKYLQREGNKLCDPKIGQKTYWKIMNKFLNKCKVPRIPPLFQNRNFIVNCYEKAKLFNSYFATQCTPFENESILNNFKYTTDKRLAHIPITIQEIKDIISVLKSNKASGPDGISVTMIQFCGEAIYKPLQIIFENILETGIFPDNWKEANITPVHKKNDKQIVSNYRPISLLPIFAKIFERLVFKNLYNFLVSNNLITKHQSGFRPGDSCTNQIHMTFDDNRCLEVRSVFLDMSKAFDKVWHEGLLFKLKQNGIDGKLMNFFENYLTNRRQRVVLNGKESGWAPILSGVPQGSVLGPLLFLIYINDLECGIISKIKFFADDTSLYSIVKDPVTSTIELNHDLKLISEWARQWKMKFNPEPTKPAEEILFSHKRIKPHHPPLSFNGVEVKRVSEHKHLGLTLDPKLNFISHINEKTNKARTGIGLIRHLRSYLPTKSLDQIYKMHVRPHLDYCDFIYHIPPLKNELDFDINLNFQMKALESLQYQAGLAITGTWRGSNRDKLYEELGWETLQNRRWFRRLIVFYKIMNNLTPKYMVEPVPIHIRHLYGLRPSNVIRPFICRNDRFEKSFYPDSVKCWNSIGPEFRQIPTLSLFKSQLLNIIRPKKKSIFQIHSALGMKYIFQLRVGLSSLKAHKKAHNFTDTPDDKCSCNTGIENNVHFLIKCPHYTNQRQIMLSTVCTQYHFKIAQLYSGG